MIKKIIISAIIAVSITAETFSQGIGINATGANADASAGLDVNFTNKGLLIPRVALTITTSPLPVTAPGVSLLVYNTATVADVTPGFYYWKGAVWERLQTGVSILTLDQAYDAGGSGLGRTIVANAGALKVTGEDGFLVTGTFGIGDSVEIIGSGTRMFFNPQKAAFRAGRVTGSQWNNGNIGNYSTAFGFNNRAFGSQSTAMGNGTSASGSTSTAIGNSTSASGSTSTAMGNSTSASGSTSTAMGNLTYAAGTNSTAMGSQSIAIGSTSTAMGGTTTANGDFSTAMGASTLANGDFSTAMGIGTIANGIGTLSIGMYNDSLYSSQSPHGPASPLFIIGNGSSNTLRSNAMMVQYSGNVGIGTNSPQSKLDIAGGLTIGSGVFYAGFNAAPTNGAIIEGTVGIGTFLPKSKLDVKGGITIGENYAGSSAAPTSGVIIEGKVGIGTKTPQSKLDIEGGLTVGATFAGVNAAPTNGVLIEGKVGIGTLSPQSKLDVAGGLAVGLNFAGFNAAPTNGAIIQGNVGIGTTSPATALHIEGGADVSLTGAGYFILGDPGAVNIAMDNNEIMCRSNGAASDIYIQQDGGRVAIGSTGVPTHILHIDGQGRSTSSSWATTSDQRVKKNINSLPNTSLQKIMQLRPVTYEWTENYNQAFKGLKQNNTGFISQELEQVFPEMIEKVAEKIGNETISDFRLLNLSDLPVHIVKAMQEQQAQIENAELKLKNQELKLEELKKELNEIKEVLKLNKQFTIK